MTSRSFSGRQLALLEMLDQIGIDGHVTIEEAQTLNQSTFRSAMIRGYCIYRSTGPNRGFHVTKEGREELRAFRAADVTRKNPHGPLTKYFDAQAYGLTAKPKMIAAKAPRGPAPRGVRDNVREFLKKGA